MKQAYNPCIYILKKGRKVVYVGHTARPNPFSRIMQHYGEKDFDSVNIMPCKLDNILKEEANMIRRHNPKYNVHFSLDLRKPKK